MTKLDEIALNIELVLISIIEGVALTSLGDHATDILRGSEWLVAVPFVLGGLTIILVFWSQAILHAVSFIRWPLKMQHMLLYFVAAFIQMLAYSQLGNPLLWFFYWTLFSLFTFIIYGVDLRIIRASYSKFEHREGGLGYIKDIERRHVNEFKYLVPIALAFNFLAMLLILIEPAIFAQPQVVAVLGTLQFLVSLGALMDCVKNFRTRAMVLPKLFD